MIEDYCPEKAISFTIPIVGLPAESIGVVNRPYRSLRGFERNRDIAPTERLGRITRRIITLKTIGFVLVASLLAPLAATALRSDDTSADLVVAAKELSRLLV